jgi:hypothetical protein
VVFDTSISGARYSTGGYLNVGNYQYATSEISPLSLPNSNFTGRFSNAGVLTVDAQPITATYLASDKRMDGSASAQVVSMTTGFLAGDRVSDHWVSASFDTASVGNGKTVSINGVQLQGVDNTNYRLINPLALTTANILPVDVPQEPRPKLKPILPWHDLQANPAIKQGSNSHVLFHSGAAVANEEGGATGAVVSAAGEVVSGHTSRSTSTDEMAACTTDVPASSAQDASPFCICKPTLFQDVLVCTEARPNVPRVSRSL